MLQALSADALMTGSRGVCMSVKEQHRGKYTWTQELKRSQRLYGSSTVVRESHLNLYKKRSRAFYTPMGWHGFQLHARCYLTPLACMGAASPSAEKKDNEVIVNCELLLAEFYDSWNTDTFLCHSI